MYSLLFLIQMQKGAKTPSDDNRLIQFISSLRELYHVYSFTGHYVTVRAIDASSEDVKAVALLMLWRLIVIIVT